MSGSETLLTENANIAAANRNMHMTGKENTLAVARDRGGWAASEFSSDDSGGVNKILLFTKRLSFQGYLLSISG